MKNLKDKVAAITGAASGIGRALALNLADEGCHLAISDINEAGLKETAEMARSRNKSARITTHKVNTANRDQVKQYAADVVKAHGAVHIIINNAGVLLLESLEDVNYDDFEWIIGINMWGVIYGSKEFLPYLRREDEAHIVNISSVNGIFTNPNNGPYCTAKYAVRGFTETLAQELSGTGIKVSCVHPGGIKTSIADNARFYKCSDASLRSREDAAAFFNRTIANTTADKAAKIIIAGIKKNKLRIMVGPDAYLMDWMKRLLPVGFQKFAGRKAAPKWMKKKAGIKS